MDALAQGLCASENSDLSFVSLPGCGPPQVYRTIYEPLRIRSGGIFAISEAWDSPFFLERRGSSSYLGVQCRPHVGVHNGGQCWENVENLDSPWDD